jgi:hypothetical protein
MTNNEMKQQIERSAEAELAAGAQIDIDRRFGWVSLTMSSGDEYFFQGDEGYDLIDEHDKSADLFDVTCEQSILHSAQGW